VSLLTALKKVSGEWCEQVRREEGGEGERKKVGERRRQTKRERERERERDRERERERERERARARENDDVALLLTAPDKGFGALCEQGREERQGGRKRGKG